MFVAIDNIDKNAIKVEDLIQRTRNKGEITPEFAMEILSLTNHRSNIKKLVTSIKDRCTTKEQLMPYREFILSCVDGREMSEMALADLREMATLCGCEKEFDKANGKSKFYDVFACNNTLIVKSNEELNALEGENLKVYFDAEDVILRNCMLDYVKDLRFRDGANICFGFVKNLPEILDFSTCNNVSFYRVEFDGVKELRFKDGAVVNFERVDSFPKMLDFSMCSDVCFASCNLNKVKKIKFKDEEQKNKFMDGVKNFNGKFVYTEVENKRLPVNGGMDM